MPIALRRFSTNSVQEEVWNQIWDEAALQFKTQSWKSGDLQEFGIDRYLHDEVLSHKSLACGIAHNVGGKLQANQSVSRGGGGVCG